MRPRCAALVLALLGACGSRIQPAPPSTIAAPAPPPTTASAAQPPPTSSAPPPTSSAPAPQPSSMPSFVVPGTATVFPLDLGLSSRVVGYVRGEGAWQAVVRSEVDRLRAVPLSSEPPLFAGGAPRFVVAAASSGTPASPWVVVSDRATRVEPLGAQSATVPIIDAPTGRWLRNEGTFAFREGAGPSGLAAFEETLYEEHTPGPVHLPGGGIGDTRPQLLESHVTIAPFGAGSRPPLVIAGQDARHPGDGVAWEDVDVAVGTDRGAAVLWNMEGMLVVSFDGRGAVRYRTGIPMPTSIGSARIATDEAGATWVAARTYTHSVRVYALDASGHALPVREASLGDRDLHDGSALPILCDGHAWLVAIAGNDTTEDVVVFSLDGEGDLGDPAVLLSRRTSEPAYRHTWQIAQGLCAGATAAVAFGVPTTPMQADVALVTWSAP